MFVLFSKRAQWRCVKFSYFSRPNLHLVINGANLKKYYSSNYNAVHITEKKKSWKYKADLFLKTPSDKI
jgi:hypothetical protein